MLPIRDIKAIVGDRRCIQILCGKTLEDGILIVGTGDRWDWFTIMSHGEM
jgi:hypothetical protein